MGGRVARSGAGRKGDTGKPPWDLAPWRAVSVMVRVLGFGARRYGPENWRKVENRRDRYSAAALRHLVAWKLGEKKDPETGESHLAHTMCCVAFLLDEEEEKQP